jgi:hypothetical protein
MKTNIIIYALTFIFLVSCKEQNPMAATNACDDFSLDTSLNYNDLVHTIDEEIIALLVEVPDENGALGRNKQAYIHARFQLNITKLTDFAIKNQRDDALDYFIASVAYSFSRQTSSGDFEFIAPADLLSNPEYKAPSNADLASASAFFAYSLGISLNSLNKSDWYNNNSQLQSHRDRIDAFDKQIIALLAFLKSNIVTLKEADKSAPNRLLFDAIAFYSLGLYVDDTDALLAGKDFLRQALNQTHPDGYFLEGGGWDSSYNGVAAAIGFELFSLLNENSNDAIASELASALICATVWQKSRIKDNGEIITEGNTRVYPGGEAFIGTEKEVDVEKTVKTFLYVQALSGDPEYKDLAEKVLTYFLK